MCPRCITNLAVNQASIPRSKCAYDMIKMCLLIVQAFYVDLNVWITCCTLRPTIWKHQFLMTITVSADLNVLPCLLYSKTCEVVTSYDGANQWSVAGTVNQSKLNVSFRRGIVSWSQMGRYSDTERREAEIQRDSALPALWVLVEACRAGNRTQRFG